MKMRCQEKETPFFSLPPPLLLCWISFHWAHSEEFTWMPELTAGPGAVSWQLLVEDIYIYFSLFYVLKH